MLSNLNQSELGLLLQQPQNKLRSFYPRFYLRFYPHFFFLHQSFLQGCSNDTQHKFNKRCSISLIRAGLYSLVIILLMLINKALNWHINEQWLPDITPTPP